jgi:hypothetical protein
LNLAEAAAHAQELAEAGDERGIATLRREWEDEVEEPRAILTTAFARSAIGRSASSAPPEGRAPATRSRGREPGVPGLGARLARAPVPGRSRNHQSDAARAPRADER